ncbi:MAG: hypothetical protein E4H02_01730 [Lentisphaerales bacterium]|jgi:hypothetical protein|nr:MAG: hypothetical protein E4H02_01730 [Lentisphaerales bacterium]
MASDTTTIWQGIEVTTPASWEMLRFGSRRERGACSFSDEFAERLQLSWAREAERPDFERLISDLRAKYETEYADDPGEDPPPDFLDLPAYDHWHGLVIIEGEKHTTRAARYFPETQALVEMTFLWEASRDDSVEHKVLQSVKVHMPSERQRWKAFGIDAEIPGDLRLSACKCLPGDAQLSFAGRRSLPSVTIRRMAFPSVWLKEPLGNWLLNQLPGRSRVQTRNSVATSAGHSVEQIVSIRSRGSLGFLLGLRITRLNQACLCPREQRVYHVATDARREATRLVSLRCECGSLLAPQNTF